MAPTQERPERPAEQGPKDGRFVLTSFRNPQDLGTGPWLSRLVAARGAAGCYGGHWEGRGRPGRREEEADAPHLRGHLACLGGRELAACGEGMAGCI